MNPIDTFLAELRRHSIEIDTNGVNLRISAKTMPANASELIEEGRRLKWQIIAHLATPDQCAACGTDGAGSHLVVAYWGPTFCCDCNQTNVERFDLDDTWPPAPVPATVEGLTRP